MFADILLPNFLDIKPHSTLSNKNFLTLTSNRKVLEIILKRACFWIFLGMLLGLWPCIKVEVEFNLMATFHSLTMSKCSYEFTYGCLYMCVHIQYVYVLTFVHNIAYQNL